MNPIRAAGAAGSIGRYAAPVLSTATIAMIASADRENSSATHAPGPAPYPVSKCANRFDASSSSRYVMQRPPQVSATASGARATCAANNTGIDTGALTGSVSTARLPISSSRGVLILIEHIHRRQPPRASRIEPVSAITTRSNRSISASMLAASNTSVRNSTVPEIPAGSPAWVQAFGQREHQVHAGGVGVGRQRGDLHITQGQPGREVVVRARRSSARPTSPGSAGDGSGFGSG